MKNILARFFDAIFITRPIILIPVWGYFLLGYYRASLLLHPAALVPVPVFGHDFFMLFSLPNSALLALIMLSFSVAATYILNQLADIKTDRENTGLPLLAKADIPRALALTENLVLTMLPLLYALMKGGSLAWFFAAAFALNLVYNLRPFYFTGRPVLDFLSNAFGFGIVAFGIGWIMANGESLGAPSAFFLAAAPYALLMAAGSINSTLPDIKGDKQTGKITTMVFFGPLRANLISIGALFAALVFSFVNRDGVAGITAAISLVLFIRYQLTRQVRHGILAFQLGGGFLMLMVVPLFPWFFLYGLATFLATRAYFRVRHNVTYPAPGVAQDP